MVDEDDKEIKIFFNTLEIKVFSAGQEIVNLDLIEIKINKIDKRDKQMNESKCGIIIEKIYTCNIHLSALNF